MSKIINLKDIGSDEATVADIKIKVGDIITDPTQVALTLEGDKAAIDIEVGTIGTISEILVSLNQKVTSDTPFLKIEENNVSFTDAEEVKENLEENKVANTDETKIEVIIAPDLGSDSVTVTAIQVNIGDVVSINQDLLTTEGDKAAVDIPSSISGVVEEILVKVNDTIKTGDPIFKIRTTISKNKPSVDNIKEVKKEKEINLPKDNAKIDSPIKISINEVESKNTFIYATPIVRSLAREYGINLDLIKGTGHKNRITREDIKSYLKNAVKAISNNSDNLGSFNGINLLSWPKVDFSKFGPIEEKELGKIPKISGANLHRNWVYIPHVTQWDNADITLLEEFRKAQNALMEKQKTGIKITPLVFIMKAVAAALKKFPKLNSSLNSDASIITLKKYINIGIAVDTPNGLVVPVFKDVDKKGVLELSKELMEISTKAREGKLTGSDMQGGCFTISSLGGIGGTQFTPIVNAPEVAILGVSKSEIKPVWNGKEFTPKLLLPLSLSYDHRALDGAEGARFITEISNNLSDLRKLIM